METLKRFGIAALIVLFVIFAILDFWWLYVLMFGPDKEIVNTFHVGTITTNPDEDSGEEPKTEYVIKIKYSSNENKNGLECLDIQFSGFVDETTQEIYSWGIQFVAKSQNDSLSNWIYNVDKSTLTGELWNKWQFPLTWKYYHNIWGSYTPSNSNIYYYKSSDSFTHDITGASRLGNGEGFLINIGEDIYKLNFTGNVVNGKDNFVAEKIANAYNITVFYRHIDIWDYYYSYDIYDFAYMLYNQVQAVSNGKHSASLINLPDMFSYQVFNGKTYVDVSEKENSKVSETVRNFYSIYIEKTADGVKTANDSMFHCVNGTPQFNITEDDETPGVVDDDYLVGNTIIDCTVHDFEFINVRDNIYSLKLKDDFVDFYTKYASQIQLSVNINLDWMAKHNMVFYGFVDNSNLSKFKILDCYTTRTINGEIVRTEVKL
ncbi:MAG: hypothetical protein ACI4R8_03700 [Candidatus Caccovivens sp.]